MAKLGYHHTAFVYTDASVRSAPKGAQSGLGMVGRIGSRLIARASPIVPGVSTSDKAEVEAAIFAIRSTIQFRPGLRRLQILTDNEGVQRYLAGRPLPYWLEVKLRPLLEDLERRGCELVSTKVKGHDFEDVHAHGNGMAHHLAMLGRIGETIEIDVPYRKDWLSALWRADRRLDSVPLPPFVDVKLAMRVLDLDKDTVLKLIAGRHMQYDFAYGGIRRKSIEAIRQAKHVLQRSLQEAMASET